VAEDVLVAYNRAPHSTTGLPPDVTFFVGLILSRSHKKPPSPEASLAKGLDPKLLSFWSGPPKFIDYRSLALEVQFGVHVQSRVSLSLDNNSF